ncbi:hypothetical protein [Brevibacillus brevis]|uniref:hypothetical protein n=2 Tax=Brevibacillus brevis TaxID=1393 RepID=UPI000D0FA593|nr:hypothetical protein [Brevibacillus brevis]PSJ67331.1 hypothetical protein C7J99_21360 [Brevibacillus brevis]RED21678.1 hypothetical protein DES34_119105 [Brevibacillus brevis]VEF86650.1 Uncharacterised protein [Brevibacillus brevis]
MAIKVEPAFLEFIRNTVSAKLNNAIITVDGKSVIHPITQTKHMTSANKTVVELYVYLDATDAAGTITEAKLVDASGAAMISSDASISSHETGALLLFEIPFEVRSV